MLVEKTDFIKQMMECETFAKIEEEILIFLKTVRDYLKQKKKSHNTDLKSEIPDFGMERTIR